MNLSLTTEFQSARAEGRDIEPGQEKIGNQGLAAYSLTLFSYLWCKLLACIWPMSGK